MRSWLKSSQLTLNQEGVKPAGTCTCQHRISLRFRNDCDLRQFQRQACDSPLDQLITAAEDSGPEGRRRTPGWGMHAAPASC